jgi:nicotinamidase-related amidase
MSRAMNYATDRPAIARYMHQQLRGASIDTIIITGDETDVCVLATMMGAVDWGFRVILVTDAARRTKLTTQ